MSGWRNISEFLIAIISFNGNKKCGEASLRIFYVANRQEIN